ncbi:MAG: FtsX-like permease family protein [Gemmatimonadota bacterium]|nr:FtsX-like permease family protein [Gemmatimonadota bacterium]
MIFPILVRLALRNLRRYLRRTVLTASAMMVGGAFLVWSMTIDRGSHEQWVDSGVRLGSGHVTVERPEYRLRRRIEDRLTADVSRAAERALASPEIAPHVVATSAKLDVNGLASSAAGARPAQIVGVDPVAEADFGALDDEVIEGRYLEPGDRLGAYVGVDLARSLELDIGSRFVVQAQDAQGEISGQLLRVVGIFRSRVPAIDQGTIHILRETAGEWLGSGGDVTNVAILLEGSSATAEVASRMERALSEPVARGEARVLGWREANPVLADAIAIDEFGNYVIQGFLFVIIAFGIVNTVLMSVLHRQREFGVLRAQGLTPGQTGTLVLIEGLTLSAVSGLVGVGLGLLGTWYFFGDGLDASVFMQGMDELTVSGAAIDPIIVPIFGVRLIVQIVVFILAIGALASVYPALRAARVDVTEAMKFDR